VWDFYSLYVKMRALLKGEKKQPGKARETSGP